MRPGETRGRRAMRGTWGWVVLLLGTLGLTSASAKTKLMVWGMAKG